MIEDGFAGYHGCPSQPCTGTLAETCVAAGDCVHRVMTEHPGSSFASDIARLERENAAMTAAIGGLGPVGTTLAFLASVIECGEPMTEAVRRDIDEARHRLAAAADALTGGEG